MSGKKIFELIMSMGSVALGFYIADALAGGAANTSGIAGIATTVENTFSVVGKMMAGGAYLTGFGLIIGSLFKFKQHKDNPQSVQMGTPITMLLIGVALAFLPSIIQPAGQSIFGGNATVGGFQGSGVSSMPGGNS